MIINEPEIAHWAIQTIVKLWGREYWMVNNEHYCLKFLKMNPGFKSSIHAHKKKDETFLGISGQVNLSIYRKDGVFQFSQSIEPMISTRITPMTYHSFQASNISWVMEVSTHHDDKDVIRLQESCKL
jgi:D-lyxose ketol-isomerase